MNSVVPTPVITLGEIDPMSPELSLASRVDHLTTLIEHRRAELKYLKDVMQQQVRWMNVVEIQPQGFDTWRKASSSLFSSALVQPGEEHYFYLLSLSLGKCIDQYQDHPVIFVRSLVQLMEEFEAYEQQSKTHTTGLLLQQNMKLLMSRSSGGYYPYTTEEYIHAVPLSEPFKPTLQKWRVTNDICYQHLLSSITTSFTLDLTSVLLSLSEMLQLAWATLYQSIDELVQSSVVHQTVLQFDKRIETKVIQIWTKTLHDYSITVTRQALAGGLTQGLKNNKR